MPPSAAELNKEPEYGSRLGWGVSDGVHSDVSWEGVQQDFVELALFRAGLSWSDLKKVSEHALSVPFANLVTGVVIMADWLASDEWLFPLVRPIGSNGGYVSQGVVDFAGLQRRGDIAWHRADIVPAWNELVERAVTVDTFAARFRLPDGAKIRPVQKKAVEVACSMRNSGLLIIEAPMGEGKTEAALAASEIMAVRFGCGGVCVALPTMATTDAMFGRVHEWVNHLPVGGNTRESMFLAHGKARLNEEYRGLVRGGVSDISHGAGDIGIDVDSDALYGSERAIVSSWMRGRKKGMLANFVVCTVDQVLMGALQMRHLSLRQLALAGKVVVIDECHAYDTYMQEYLCCVLGWLGVYRTPVVLLSATLPKKLRDRFAEAYKAGAAANVAQDMEAGYLLDAANIARLRSRSRLAKRKLSVARASDEDELSCAYPVITLATQSSVKSIEVERSSRVSEIEVQLVPDGTEDLVALLVEKLADGGCAGVLCDTVVRAQETAEALKEKFSEDEVMLVHARFMDLDRMENEVCLRGKLGPDATIANGKRPHRFLVVGTQVLEQSLDVDFDVMVTDAAPVDLILQRLGRVHRHMRGCGQCDRPEGLRSAVCYVRGIEEFSPEPRFSKGVDKVYEPAALMEALGVLNLHAFGDKVAIALPGDIAPLVQRAYGRMDGSVVPETWKKLYLSACEARQGNEEEKRRRSGAYRIPPASELVADATPLDNFAARSVDADARRRRDEDFGPRAVRDTQETVEVLLLEQREDGLHLLPWIGEPAKGVDYGAIIPRDMELDEDLASVMAQCAVRLPAAMCNIRSIDTLIDELEERCGPFAAAWQDSSWVGGSLFLVLERSGDRFETTLLGWRVVYTREGGLSVVRDRR